MIVKLKTILLILSWLALTCPSNEVIKPIPFNILTIENDFQFTIDNYYMEGIDSLIEFESRNVMGRKPCDPASKVKIRKLHFDSLGFVSKIDHFKYKTNDIRTTKSMKYKTYFNRSIDTRLRLEITDFNDSKSGTEFFIQRSYEPGEFANVTEEVYSYDGQLIAYIIKEKKENKYVKNGFINRLYIEDIRRTSQDTFVHILSQEKYYNDRGKIDSIVQFEPTPISDRPITRKYGYSYDKNNRVAVSYYIKEGWMKTNRDPWRRDTTSYKTIYNYDNSSGRLESKSRFTDNDEYPSLCTYYQY